MQTRHGIWPDSHRWEMGGFDKSNPYDVGENIHQMFRCSVTSFGTPYANTPWGDLNSFYFNVALILF
jgi:hypothetical protein